MNAVDEITAAAEREGEAPLPALTQAELCALGAAAESLVCERTWNWWAGLDEDERVRLTARALGLLTHRGLVRPGRGDLPGIPVPELGLILAARARPRLIVVCQVPGKVATFEPRFFGMTATGTGLRVLVREILTDEPSGPGGRRDFGTVLAYALVTPARAAELICEWAREAGQRYGGDAARPVVDLFGHHGDGQPFQNRFELRPAEKSFDVRYVDTGIPPGRFGENRTRQMLTDELIRAGR